MLVTHYTVPWEVELYTDASGSWGCGGIWNNSWFSCAWNNEWSGVGIAAKELLPVVLAVGIWGKLWQHKHVCVHTDNMAVVEVIKAKDSKVPLMMHLLRCLHFLCARWDIVILAKHVKGSLNTAADALSWNSLQVLRSVAPSAHVNPTPIPTPLWQLLVSERPDWLSPNWKHKLTDFYYMESPSQPRSSIGMLRTPSCHSASASS